MAGASWSSNVIEPGDSITISRVAGLVRAISASGDSLGEKKATFTP